MSHITTTIVVGVTVSVVGLTQAQASLADGLWPVSGLTGPGVSFFVNLVLKKLDSIAAYSGKNIIVSTSYESIGNRQPI